MDLNQVFIGFEGPCLPVIKIELVPDIKRLEKSQWRTHRLKRRSHGYHLKHN